MPRRAGVPGCACGRAVRRSPVWRAVRGVWPVAWLVVWPVAWLMGGTTAAWGADAGNADSVSMPPLVSPALQAPDPPLVLHPSTALRPPPTGDSARQRPMILQADTLQVRPEVDAVADGDVEFRRAGTVIRADHFRYDTADDLANARGQVVVTRDGVRYSGPELQLQVQRFEGFFLQPDFEFTRLGAGGHADRIDFLDSDRLRADRLIYTSCPRDAGAEPDWLLRAKRVKLDFAANEGVAEGAVLQFLGVPILGLPVLSFPLSDDRKSGWLPPTVVPIDSRNGFTLAVPYYWNIAPNRDATLIPTLLTRRGLALDSEFRYLEAQHSGRVRLNWLPQDSSTGRHRYAWELDNKGQLLGGVGYTARWRQVSDDGVPFFKLFWPSPPSAFPFTPAPLTASSRSITNCVSTPPSLRCSRRDSTITGSTPQCQLTSDWAFRPSACSPKRRIPRRTRFTFSFPTILRTRSPPCPPSLPPMWTIKKPPPNFSTPPRPTPPTKVFKPRSSSHSTA